MIDRLRGDFLSASVRRLLLLGAAVISSYEAPKVLRAKRSNPDEKAAIIWIAAVALLPRNDETI